MIFTLALVGKDGSIDLMSFPRFDSPTVFARLLDHDRGGHYAIRPRLTRGVEKQLYLPDTNVLLTRFLSADGVAELSDFMPVAIPGHPHSTTLVRRVKTVRGSVCYDVEFAPRFDYGRAVHSVEQRDDSLVFHSCGDDATALRLSGEMPLIVDGAGAARPRFTLGAGDSAAFVMEAAHTRACPVSRPRPTSCPGPSNRPSTSCTTGSGGLNTRGGGARSCCDRRWRSSSSCRTRTAR